MERVGLGAVPYDGGVTSHGFALDDVTMASLSRLAAESGVPLPSDADIRDAVALHLSKSQAG